MNNIVLSGIPSGPHYLYKYKGQKYYELYISTKRFSGYVDVLPCVVSENLVKSFCEEPIVVIGSIKTRNVKESGKNKVKVFVFVKGVQPYLCKDENAVLIDGFICKKPTFRETPLTKKWLSDVLVASNRIDIGSDYLPCICWGEEARNMAEANVGQHIIAKGRFQSRTYEKHIGDITEIKTAYEVSVSKLEVVTDEE